MEFTIFSGPCRKCVLKKFHSATTKTVILFPVLFFTFSLSLSLSLSLSQDSIGRSARQIRDGFVHTSTPNQQHQPKERKEVPIDEEEEEEGDDCYEREVLRDDSFGPSARDVSLVRKHWKLALAGGRF